MDALAEVKRSVFNRVWGVSVLPKNGEKNEDDLNPSQIDYSEAPKIKTKRHLLEGFKAPGIEITSVNHISEKRLKLERTGRILASAGSVLLNIWAAVGLVFSGLRLVFSSAFNTGNLEDTYDGLSKSFLKTGLAGTMTGLAHEDLHWAIGNAGMGYFSKFINEPWGLAAFSLFDGLSAVGMGKVRYREKKNPFAIQHSLFNIPLLRPLKFLQSVEQSVFSFYKRISSKSGWQTLFFDEPYRMFKDAGGGLISAGGILGIASVFQNKMSEKLKSLAFLPYSLLSMLNLIALSRDGQMVVKRTNAFAAAKESEDFTQQIEGYSKQIAAPFLSVNSMLLALKGLGLDSESGIMYHLANGFRACGAGMAMIGFAAQSLLKFSKPILFGPLLKDVVKVNLNPKVALQRLFKFLHDLESQPLTEFDIEKMKITNQFKSIIDSEKKLSGILNEIINTPTFQSMKTKSLTAFPSVNDIQTHLSIRLNRFDHSIGAGAIGILVFDELLRNTSDPAIRKELEKYEIAFKITTLIHDCGHIARSHVAEMGIEGFNNDENLRWMLDDKDSDIRQIIVNGFGEEVLGMVKNIIGHKHFLYKALKDCDRMEYQGFSDYISLRNPRLKFYNPTIGNVKEFANKMRLFWDIEGNIDLGYTEVGAIQKLLREQARQIFNVSVNEGLRNLDAEIPYCLGLAANKKINSKNILHMSQDEVDRHALEGVNNLINATYTMNLDSTTGDEYYTGYSPDDRNNRIWVVNGRVKEVLHYIETDVKKGDINVYNELVPIVRMLRTPRLKRLEASISNDYAQAA